MAVQTNYEDTQPVAVAGAQATMLRGDLISRTVEEAAIGFGRAVTQGATDKGCVAFGAGDTTFLGITVLDRSASGLSVTSGQVIDQTADSFGVGESARISAVGGGGDVWVVCATGCSAGDSVFVRPSNGDFQDSNANSAVQIPGARWDTSAEAGALAVVRLA
jgi:hypothetical protein